jgi:16S rRNA (uracil1498-N3)-methyltransferase
MIFFYEPEILSNGGFLNEEESKHCIRVLRHKEGDKITVMDGKGNLISGKIIDASSKSCRITILDTITETQPEAKCHIAIAPTKNMDRMEWFLEKSTEVGIDRITPIVCRNSERRTIKQDRLDKIITTATKQSVSLWRPKLMALTDFNIFVNQSLHEDKFIAVCDDTIESHLKDLCKPGRNTHILIGPEGDFNQSEIDMAIAHGFIPVSLGKKRLRTETAALMACHIVSLINE